MLAFGIQVNWITFALVFLGPLAFFLGVFSQLACIIAILCWLFIPVFLLRKPWYYVFYAGWITVGVIVTKILIYMVQ